jgi:DNA-binding CsgD family transcriptional regulator
MFGFGADLTQYDFRRILCVVARLSEAKYLGVLDVLRLAGEVEGPVPFPEPVLESLRRLVPCDVVAYHERLPGGRILAYSGEPRGKMTPAIREASRRLEAEDVLKPAGGARKYSDFFSTREYHRSPIYLEVGRPLGVEDMVRLWIDPAGAFGARLEFDRPDRGFQEADRTALDLLRPHLLRFVLNALTRRRRAAPTGRVGRLTPREREILEHVAVGRTNTEVARLLWISPGTVRKHLENAYEKLEVHTRTAAVAALHTAQAE